MLSRKNREERNFKETIRRIEQWQNSSLDANVFLSCLVQGLDQLQTFLRANEAEIDAEWLQATSAIQLSKTEDGLVISASGGSASIHLGKSLPRLAAELVTKSERLVSAEDRTVVRRLLWFLCVNSCLEVINSPFSYYTYADSLAVKRAISRGKSFIPGVLPEVNTDGVVVVKRVIDPTLPPRGVGPGIRLLSLNGRPLSGQSWNEIIDWWFQPAPFKYRLRIQSGSQEATVQSTAVPWRHESVAATCWRGLAYVRISFFSTDTLIELRRFLRTLEASRPAGMIIDLRSNSGGVRSFEVVDLFFKPGEIIGSFKELARISHNRTLGGQIDHFS
ncbi:MAG TPA: S41 family peptidase, partial [Acidobacteriota bacterium]|nr:S41 family peptidase [Acidobacteriota bacterium]